MFPFGLAVGFVAGAAGAILFAPQIAEHARPVVKAALKAALTAMHEARLRSAELAEAAEDLYAEANAEVAEEVRAAAEAAAETEAAGSDDEAGSKERAAASPVNGGAAAKTSPAAASDGR